MVQNLQLLANKFGIRDINSARLTQEMVHTFLNKNSKRLRESFKQRNAQLSNQRRTSPLLERSDRAQSAATADDPINLCSDDDGDEEGEISSDEYVTPPTSPLNVDPEEDTIERKYEFYKFLYEGMSKLNINRHSHTAESRSATINKSRKSSSSISYKASTSSSHIASTSSHRVSKRTHKEATRSHREPKSSHRSTKGFRSPSRDYTGSQKSYRPTSKNPKEYVAQSLQLRYSKSEGFPRVIENKRHGSHHTQSHSSRHTERRNSSDKKVEYMVISDDEESESINDNNDGISNGNGSETVDEDMGDVTNEEDIYGTGDESKANPLAVTSVKEIQSFFNHPARQQDDINHNQNSASSDAKGIALRYKSIEQMLGVHASGSTSQEPSKALCPKESRGGVCFDPYCSYSHCKDFEQN